MKHVRTWFCVKHCKIKKKTRKTFSKTYKKRNHRHKIYIHVNANDTILSNTYRCCFLIFELDNRVPSWSRSFFCLLSLSLTRTRFSLTTKRVCDGIVENISSIFFIRIQTYANVQCIKHLYLVLWCCTSIRKHFKKTLQTRTCCVSLHNHNDSSLVFFSIISLYFCWVHTVLCFFCCRFHHIQMHSQGKWIKCTDWKFAIQCKIVCAWKRQLLWPKWMKIKRAKHLIEQIEVCDKLRIVLFDVVEPITFKFKVPTFLKRWRFVLFTAAVAVRRSCYCSIRWKFLRCLQWHFISSTKIDRAGKIQQ